jgi:hypothetical protein
MKANPPLRTSARILLALTAAAALSIAHPAKANLVTNGGFETGDFTGWTVSGSAAVGVDFVPPHSGAFKIKKVTAAGFVLR